MWRGTRRGQPVGLPRQTKAERVETRLHVNRRRCDAFSPFEPDTCLNAHRSEPRDSVTRSAGSCLGALIRLLDRHPESFHDFGLAGSDTNDVNNNENRAGAHPSSIATAGQIFSYLHSYLITHAHWGEQGRVSLCSRERCASGRMEDADSDTILCLLSPITRPHICELDLGRTENGMTAFPENHSTDGETPCVVDHALTGSRSSLWIQHITKVRLRVKADARQPV